MPAQFLPYLESLVIGVNVTATGIAQQSKISHDQITRFLIKRISWTRFLIFIIQRLFGNLKGGYLLLDDTVIAKPYAKNLEGAGFVHSSVLDRIVYGYNIVFVCWSDGKQTIPLSFRFYQKKKDGKTKIDLALELLEEAKNTWGLSPQYVLFDKFYGADKLLNRLLEYGWKFTGQLKCNRIINGAPVKEDLVNEGDTTVGYVTDKVKVQIIKHDDKWFFTSNLDVEPTEIPQIYKYRWGIEEVFQFLKSELSLERCQARRRTAQKTHLASCLVAYLILIKEREGRELETLYAIKRTWQIDRRLGRNQIRHYVKVLSA